MPAFSIVDAEIQRVLSASFGSRIDYYAEYVDVVRFADPNYVVALRDFLRQKYAHTDVAVVIATSTSTFELARDNRALLFPDAAIVAVFSPTDKRVEKTTGVILDINMHGTLDVALALQPDLTQVFVVTGDSAFDRFYEEVARTEFHPYTNRLTFTYLSGLAMDDLEKRVAQLPERSIVYFLMLTSDGVGRRWAPIDSLDRVAAHANVPVYHWVETAIGHGVVGGNLMTFVLPAKAIAEQAVRVLNGGAADDIPVEKIEPNVITIDWNQLRRWNLNEARLPASAVVRFREDTAWEKYRLYIIGAVCLVGLQSFLIAALVVSRAKRRRAQSALRESYTRIRDLAGRLITAQEAERARIARDLHDDVGQRVASFSIAVGTLKRRLNGADEVVRADLASLQAETIALSKDLRLLSHELHPGLLQQLGLVEALRARCDELERESTLSVGLDVGPGLGVVSDEASLCLYRVAQEALRNVVRHARARTVRLLLERHDGHVSLRISDDGRGFQPVRPSSVHGIGLVSLEERVRVLDGTFRVDSSERSGTTVSVTVPCDGTDATTARPAGG
jgi:signal transduction histidine kinase